jgi:CDP-diacylglycerol--serine O-phosphatidyltransferase
MFDGKVARMIKGRTEEDKQYGIQIDSLADMVSFIVFPIVLLYGVAKYYDIGLCMYVAIPVVTLFTVAGISRLAFFNLNAGKEDGPVKYYTGLPVTTTSMIFPLIYILKYVLADKVFVSIYLAMFAVIAFLMVFNFKLRKPKGNIWYIACSVVAIIGIAVLLFLRAHH